MIDGLSGKNLFNFYYLTEISIVNFSKRFNILTKISLGIDQRNRSIRSRIVVPYTKLIEIEAHL